MIGLSFLIRLLLVIFYVGVILLILYLLIFGITWMIRLFAEGMGITLSDHKAWLRSKMPKRKRKRRL